MTEKQFEPLGGQTIAEHVRDVESGIAWWNFLSVDQRKNWLDSCGEGASAADAWDFYKIARGVVGAAR